MQLDQSRTWTPIFDDFLSEQVRASVRLTHILQYLYVLTTFSTKSTVYSGKSQFLGRDAHDTKLWYHDIDKMMHIHCCITSIAFLIDNHQ